MKLGGRPVRTSSRPRTSRTSHNNGLSQSARSVSGMNVSDLFSNDEETSEYPSVSLPVDGHNVISPIGVANGFIYQYLQQSDCDVSWVEAHSRGESNSDSSTSNKLTQNRLWDQFLCLHEKGPYVLDRTEIKRTFSRLKSYMSCPFRFVDQCFVHFYRLFLCSIKAPTEMLDIRRLLSRLTNVQAVNKIHVGETNHVFLENPKRRSQTSNSSKFSTSTSMSKWALNETALMTEMLMSSGTIRSITVGTKHISKNGVHSTSPFTRHLGAILSSNSYIDTLIINCCFKYDEQERIPIGLQSLLSAMDTLRGGTSRLIRIDLTAGCGNQLERKKKTKATNIHPLYSSFGEENGYATIEMEDSESKQKKKTTKNSGKRSAVASPIRRPDQKRKMMMREAHWSSLATLLVEGIPHCKTIKVVSIIDCHLTSCANVILPAIAIMLSRTMSLNKLCLPGIHFPPLHNKRRGNSPKKKHWNSKPSSTKLFCNAVLDCTAGVSSSLTELDISGSNIGTAASMLLSKSIGHLTAVTINNIRCTAQGLRCLLKCFAERPTTLNSKRLLLSQRIPPLSVETNVNEESSPIQQDNKKGKRIIIQQKSKVKRKKGLNASLEKKDNLNAKLDQQDECILIRSVESIRGRANTLIEVNLRRMHLGPRGGVSLASALRVCTKVTCLDVSENYMGTTTSCILLQAISSFGCRLKTLKISDNQMDDNISHSLCQLLIISESLITLDLSANHLTTSTTNQVYSSVFGRGGCPSLIDFDLSYNKVDSILSILQSYLTNRRSLVMYSKHGLGNNRVMCLEKLSLSGNLLTSTGAGMLADIIQLRFAEDNGGEWNQQRNVEIEQLSTTMLLRSGPVSSPGRKLSHGNISSTPLAASLLHLDLSNNNLGYEGGKHLGRGLSNSIYLKELNVSRTSLGSVGSFAIAEGLLHNTVLETLHLSSNLIAIDTRTNSLELSAIKKISDVIRTSTSLTALVLQDNDVGYSGSELLKDAVLSNKTMVQLDLSNNAGIPPQNLKAIERQVKDNARYQYNILSGVSSLSEREEHKVTSPVKVPPRPLSSYLSPEDKDRFKAVISSPKATLESLQSPPPQSPQPQVTTKQPDFGYLLDAALDVQLEANISDREKRRKDQTTSLENYDVEDEHFAQILLEAKQQQTRSQGESRLPPPIFNVSPVGIPSTLHVPSLNSAKKIVLDGRNEKLDKTALKRAIERMKAMF